MAVDAHPGAVHPASPAVRRGPRDPSPAASGVVRVLAAVPGATYAAAVDERSGALLAEAGAPGSGTALAALLGWARRTTRPDRLDDLVVTTDRAFHVLRRVALSGLPVWAYLRVDRQRGNLALARRAAGTALAPSRPPAAPRPVGPASGAARPALPRRPPAALPGPRGSAAPRPWSERPAPGPDAPGHRPALPVPVSGWDRDLATLDRLLAGLRRLA